MKTLRQFADDYLYRLQAGQTKRAVSSTRTQVYAFVRWLEAQHVYAPDELRDEHVYRWLSYAAARPHYRTGLPRRTFSIHSETSQVRTFVMSLGRSGVLPKSVSSAFPVLRSPAIISRVTLKHREVGRVIRGVKACTTRSHMLKAMMETAYSTAIRPCELLRMDVADVRAEHGLIRIFGKGKKERMVPIGRHAHQLLLNYIRGVRPLLSRWPEEQALWLSTRGTRMTYDRLLALLHQYVGGTFHEKVTWYSFRRACATEMARAGANIWAIKELLGHEHLETVQHYVHFSLDDLKRAHTRCHPRNLSSANSNKSAGE